MEPTDITIEILKSIRDELHDGLSSVRGELGSVRRELHDGLTGVRADLAGVTERMDRLERRQTEADLRIVTELVAIAGAVRETRDAYREERALRHRVDDHERRLADVEKRVGV
jgi:chromosome condensin MukBEF ATPase and DNA-binding subunit MukB